MPKHHKLSLRQAMLVNINIMFGVGIFINTVILAKRAGALGFLSYGIIAILITPLILAIATLLRKHPSGGFYAYGSKNINKFAGFISAWAYFVGKLGSAALLVHIFSSLIKTIIPTLYLVNTLAMDAVILALFAWLNLYNVKTGSKFMYIFIVMKLTPVLFAIFSSMYLWQRWSFPPETFLWEGIPSSLPIVLFAFVGFEAACSLSKSIKNAKENAPKVIFYSFGIVVVLNITYQFLFFAAQGTELMYVNNFLQAFPTLLRTLFPLKPLLARDLRNILHIAAASSALGGSYGILFSNHWNLFALAKHNHTFFAKKLSTLNSNHIPTWCIFTEVLICVGYLLLTNGNQPLLQQLSVLGCTVAYTVSVISLISLQRRKIKTALQPWVSWAALGSCGIFIFTCVNNLMHESLEILLALIGIFGFGILMFWITSKKKNNNQHISSHSA